jgi:biopolymer transport protein ExbD
MAELDTSGGGSKKGGKIRSKKQSTRVDLTAMVDLAFLLITFFMLTTTLAKPQAMDLVMPDDSDKEEELKVADDRSMTILLGSKDQVQWYMGKASDPQNLTKDFFGANNIRKAIYDMKEQVKKNYPDDPAKDLLILIKPSDKSTYKNLVDILDEMKVTDVKKYAIVDILPVEIQSLTSSGIY